LLAVYVGAGSRDRRPRVRNRALQAIVQAAAGGTTRARCTAPGRRTPCSRGRHRSDPPPSADLRPGRAGASTRSRRPVRWPGDREPTVRRNRARRPRAGPTFCDREV